MIFPILLIKPMNSFDRSSPAQEPGATGAAGEKFANKGADRHGSVHGGYLGWEDDQGRHLVAVLPVDGERPLSCWH